MFTYNTIYSHTDHFETQKRDYKRHPNREYTIWEGRESNPACLNGGEHDFKNIVELPDHDNTSKSFFKA